MEKYLEANLKNTILDIFRQGQGTRRGKFSESIYQTVQSLLQDLKLPGLSAGHRLPVPCSYGFFG